MTAGEADLFLERDAGLSCSNGWKMPNKDKNNIYAVIHGWGISSDGGGTGLTAPLAKGQARSIRRAYDRADYDMDAIDFIEGHGTGTTVGDKVELSAISHAISQVPDVPSRSCGVTSLKSIIGHTKAASGIGAFLKAVMAVNQRVIPPTANCTEPHSVFADDALALYPVLTGEIRPEDSTMRAGISSMGFGGINCHVTISSHDKPSKKIKPDISEKALIASCQTSELFVFSGADINELSDEVRQMKAYANAISQAEMTDLSYQSFKVMDTAAPARAAVVAGNPEELHDRLEDITVLLSDDKISATPVANASHTAWAGINATPLRIAMVFPGQGSQQLNMARHLVGRLAWAKSLVETADQILEAGQKMTISDVAFKPLEKAKSAGMTEAWFRKLSDTRHAQPAICLASALWLNYLNPPWH
jgi:enediyne polyketide synthase